MVTQAYLSTSIHPMQTMTIPKISCEKEVNCKNPAASPALASPVGGIMASVPTVKIKQLINIQMTRLIYATLPAL